MLFLWLWCFFSLKYFFAQAQQYPSICTESEGEKQFFCCALEKKLSLDQWMRFFIILKTHHFFLYFIFFFIEKSRKRRGGGWFWNFSKSRKKNIRRHLLCGKGVWVYSTFSARIIFFGRTSYQQPCYKCFFFLNPLF